MKHVVVFWEGLPSCGLLLKGLIDDSEIRLTLYATRPSVPFKDIDRLLGVPVNYVDRPEDIVLSDCLDIDLFIFTGWNNKYLLSLSENLKFKGVKTVLVSDNNLSYSFRQLIGSIYFRIFVKPKINFAFVPGQAGYRLMRFFGMASSSIFLGNYGAYSQIFNTGDESKEDSILYVGQLSDRKNFRLLVEAYDCYRATGGQLSLTVAGTGHLEKLASDNELIDYLGFVQPHGLAKLMKKSKFFVLLSNKEHWGTVVCEAAACGCVLLTSDNVGSNSDLIMNNINGYVVHDLDKAKISELFHKCENLSLVLYNGMSKSSVQKAGCFNEETYKLAVNNMLTH
jgi:glycosyltransferase involved in cell wall biosynthesis